MSALAVQAEAPSLPFDRQGWQAWLTERVDPGWRPEEWNAERWLFTGDPDNPLTAVWRCSSRGCDVAVRASRHRCRTCHEQFVASGMDREQFAEHGRAADRRNASPGTAMPCLVERDGTRCGWPATTRGTCYTHYRRWHYQSVRLGRGCDLVTWARTEAVLLAPPTTCMVEFCTDPVADNAGLCRYHRNRWQIHRRQHELPRTAECTEILKVWAAGEHPRLTGYQFSLAQVAPLARWEILYALGQRDQRRTTLSPFMMRLIVRDITGIPTLVPLSQRQTEVSFPDRNHLAHWREIMHTLRHAFDQFLGIDPLDKPTWDLAAVGLTRHGRRLAGGTADATQIQQQWLRDLLAAWVRDTSPDPDQFRRTFDSVRLASATLTRRPGGGHDPAALKTTDMDALVKAITRTTTRAGRPRCYSVKSALLHSFCALLDFARRSELLPELGSGFARQAHHRIPTEDANEQMAGRSIPEAVIRQLDIHIDRLGTAASYGPYRQDDVQAMFQTIYVLLRDTGRRPWEIRWLRRDCLDSLGGEHTLLWDNLKAKRSRRRLPITAQTATAIRTWQQRRAAMKHTPPHSADYLFPAPHPTSRHGFLGEETFTRQLRLWIDGIPALHADQPGPDGTPLPFDRRRIFPYAFRHSYAQRHADAGTPIEVLRDLMDHRSIETTMGYFQVSLRRKRDAVKTLRLQVLDRAGQPAPMTSNTAYEARAVAVPFGNCIEPANVKAGGGQCPIRFQCAGCGFYRPDPSYLPAIEDHIRSLKANRETAHAIDADEFVTRNLGDQIEAFHTVAERIRQHLHELPADQRDEVEQASKILRRTRAAQAATPLPMPTIRRPEPRPEPIHDPRQDPQL